MLLFEGKEEACNDKFFDGKDVLAQIQFFWLEISFWTYLVSLSLVEFREETIGPPCCTVYCSVQYVHIVYSNSYSQSYFRFVEFFIKRKSLLRKCFFKSQFVSTVDCIQFLFSTFHLCKSCHMRHHYFFLYRFPLIIFDNICTDISEEPIERNAIKSFFYFFSFLLHEIKLSS